MGKVIEPPGEPDSKISGPALDRLMVRYQQADEEAACAFVTAVNPTLYRFFCYHAGNREDAADLLQEAWLRIHKSRDTYRPGEPVLPWLFGIARHVRIDSYRRAQRIRSHETAVDAVSSAQAAQAPHASQLPGFAELVQPLPHTQREVITMLKLTGLSLEEIATATGCSVGSVKQKAHRAYETLRKLLGPSQDPLRRETSE